MYDEKLRAQAERDHRGEFIVVDVYSGDYAFGRNDIDATTSMLAKRPDALVYGVRVGDDVAYRLGAGETKRVR